MFMIGHKISSNLELGTVDHEISNLSHLLIGAEALVILFIPYCFGDILDDTMESLVLEVNRRIEEFNKNDLRVICISRYVIFFALIISTEYTDLLREPPTTVKHWMNDREIQLDVYCDPSLTVSNNLVGTFDLSLYLSATKGVQLGSYFVSMPGIIVVGGDGKVISKYIAASPGEYDTGIYN